MALTKVNLANTVEGILPVANGGTGTSSGVAPGGSTTQVQYNNAGAFGGDSGFVYTSGNVGVGTASPGARLNAQGSTTDSSAYALKVRNSADSTLLDVRNDGYTSFANKMYLSAAGNVGIGTSTTPYALNIEATEPRVYLKASSTGFAFSQYTNNGQTVYMGVDGATPTFFGTAYASVIYNSGAYPIIFGNNATERMRITAGGGVGIGTNNPTFASASYIGLEIYGNTLGPNIKLTNSVTGTGTGNGFDILTDASGADVYMYQRENAAIIFGTNDSTRLTITSAGGVSFGTSGTAYGSSGQVLTSQGNAAPIWSTPTVNGTAKAWVAFNNSGSILSSYNVSSVSSRGTGLWNVNFTSALADGNYAMASSASPGNTMYNSGGCFCAFQYGPSQNYSAPSSTAAYIYTTQGTYTGGDARLFNPYITSCVFYR